MYDYLRVSLSYINVSLYWYLHVRKSSYIIYVMFCYVCCVLTTVISYVIHRTVFAMCTQEPDYSAQLYDKYREMIENYVIKTVSNTQKQFGRPWFLDIVWRRHVRLILFYFFHFRKQFNLPCFSICCLGVAVDKGEAWWIYAKRAC